MNTGVLIQKLAPDDVVVMVDIVPNGSNGNSNYNVTNAHEHEEQPADRTDNSPDYDSELPKDHTTATTSNNSAGSSKTSPTSSASLSASSSHTNKKTNRSPIEMGKLDQLV